MIKTLLPLRRRDFLLGTAAAGAASGLIVSPFRHLAYAAGMAHLRLLETTDIHVHVHPYDYYRDRPDNTVGLAKTAALIAQARAEAPNALLFDNGDFLQGNPMGDLMAYERGLHEGEVHPVVAAMNVLKVDAATLGNHEFNYGLDFLMKSLAGGDFPFVLANVHNGAPAANARDDDTLVRPYVILDREIVDGEGVSHPIRIGIIGFVPPQILNWDRAHLHGKVGARDIVATAEAYIPQMREEGADIIVALSHSGISAEQQAEGMENASLYLAGVPGIDAIFTGHQHLLFPGPDYADLPEVDIANGTLRGVPATMPGFWGSHLGVIDLMLARDGNGWRVMEFKTESRPIYERVDREVTPLVEPVAAVLAATQSYHDETLEYVRRPVGETSAPINSYFALVADDPSVQIVSQAQTWYIADLLATREYADLPVLSAAAPFKAGGRGGADYYTDVPAGDIAIKNVADLYLYPNTARAVLITGAGVKEWLEMSAGMFNQVAATDAEQPLLNPDFPSYNFDVIDGVTYRIDLSRPARYDSDGNLVAPNASRIVDLMFDGRPIDPEARFVVATNNYRAGGGGHFPGLDGSNIIVQAPDTNRDVIVRYIIQQGTINPSADGNWSFAPVPGATNVTFESSPQGEKYLDSIAADVELVGPAEDGFAKYRLNLA
ncbi:bifunctional 2',3'-cyclic-nucleotide 2'-phosphodiesterase/3'-nucleotidase [Inquilinus sp. CAU 1745]|uniref:bifunctional 2',3'-cyclic-nucleotide 2'-phosphodiesterase/3'-nucleotidase n=1 Tax=Inquilinus sp. CAU 1745 TaxID=3140369 RepID=UPI00325B38F0